MVRVAAALLIGLVLICPAVRADDPPAGNWKVVLFTEDGQRTHWLIKLESRERKWTGTVLAQDAEVPKSTIEDVTLEGDVLRFRLKLNNGLAFHFEQMVPKDKETRMLGTMVLPGRHLRVHLEPTALSTLDSYEQDKEFVIKNAGTFEVVQTALELLSQAATNKAKPEEVRAWADKAIRSAEAYGPRMHRHITLDVADTLVRQDGYAPIALRYARQAERLMEDKELVSVRKRILTVLARALEKTGKVEEAREVQARNDKIPYVASNKFAGRKTRSDRAVLVELFTGAEAKVSVAADLACDALVQSYKPGEVILLCYHLHGAGGDPLTNKDTVDRSDFYGEKLVPGIPALLFNGKQGPRGGGSSDDAQSKYQQYTEILARLLEEPARVALKTRATRKGDKIEVNAEVSGLEEPANDIRLHIALVEQQVAYLGQNKLPTHGHVVRALVAGKDGIVLKDKATTRTATIDLDEVRKKLTDYLKKYEQDNKFPNNQRPMEMKKLLIVAFVQNHTTKEVLQATQVPVETSAE